MGKAQLNCASVSGGMNCDLSKGYCHEMMNWNRKAESGTLLSSFAYAGFTGQSTIAYPVTKLSQPKTIPSTGFAATAVIGHTYSDRYLC